MEQSQIKEVYEYLSVADDSWSLGRDHMTTLFRLVQEHQTGCAACALQLLCKLVLKEDIVQMIAHDKSSKLPDILHRFESSPEKVKIGILKTVSCYYLNFSICKSFLLPVDMAQTLPWIEKGKSST